MENTWRRQFEDGVFGGRLGHDRMMISPETVKPVFIKVHVDDFLIHGPTNDTCKEALDALMDMVLELGLEEDTGGSWYHAWEREDCHKKIASNIKGTI
jgi:hypothetical protein